MNHDVFISYSSKNSTTAQAICHELEDNGIKCWMAPRDIPVGSKYASVINKAIIHCKVVVLVFSDYSARSPWVESEINIAFSNRKVIIPYKIDKTNFEDFDEFYLMLNNRHWIEAYPDFKTRFKDLVTVVGQNIGAKPTPKPTANTNANKNSSTELDALRQEIERLKAEISKKQETPLISKEEATKIGDDYYYGRNGKLKNYTEAVKWYRKAAEQGHSDTQNLLGYCYEKGYGVPQDYTEAVKWYRKAAEQGDEYGQTSIGDCYYYGRGVTQNYSEAIKWYRKAAEQGDTNAQNNLGNCYYYGRGVTQNYNEAIKWYRKAAEQGDTNAQNNLGICYKYGEGVTQDYTEAIKWFYKAAEQGDTNAQNNLGDCYYYGQGVSQNHSEAIKWYRKAIEYTTGGIRCLAYSYENGYSVEKDINKAIELYRQAARQGDQLAHEALTRLGRTLNEIN